MNEFPWLKQSRPNQDWTPIPVCGWKFQGCWNILQGLAANADLCVAVDCIALNYWSKQKRKIAIRAFFMQEKMFVTFEQRQQPVYKQHQPGSDPHSFERRRLSCDMHDCTWWLIRFVVQPCILLIGGLVFLSIKKWTLLLLLHVWAYGFEACTKKQKLFHIFNELSVIILFLQRQSRHRGLHSGAYPSKESSVK